MKPIIPIIRREEPFDAIGGRRSCGRAKLHNPDPLSLSRGSLMLAGETTLLGTWKLKSFVFELPTGERFDVFGEHPDGYLSYSPDGRMYAILAADNRIKPHDVAPADEERVKLHQTMSAYAGTYTLDGRR